MNPFVVEMSRHVKNAGRICQVGLGVLACALLLSRMLGPSSWAFAAERTELSAEQISQAIAALEADNYAARVRATEQLIQAGAAAVAPLVQALEQGGLETIERGVYVLRQLSLVDDDPSLQQAAYGALETLAERRFTAAARRASTALQAVQKHRFDKAQMLLGEKGAVFGVTAIPLPIGIPLEYPSVQLGPAWRGSLEDLMELRWISEYQPVGMENRLMLILQGEHVTDAMLERVAQLDALSALRIDSAQISNRSIEAVSRLPELEVLEVLYTEINDDCVTSLTQLKKATRFRLIGNRITTEGVQRLRSAATQAEVDFRSGGFLGVSCLDNPCRIQRVQANTAAAKAGLRVNDIIVRYNGQAVNSMEELTREISRHGVGEKVSLEVLRDNQRIATEVQLGKWE